MAERKNTGEILIALLLCCMIAPAIAAEDRKGAKDHPLIKRIDSSYILGYRFNEFNEMDLPLGPTIGNTGLPAESTNVEGKFTQLIYVVPQKRSTLEILRNYESELKGLGEFEVLFECKGRSCGAGFYDRYLASKYIKVPGYTRFLWGGENAWNGADVGYFKDPRYLAAKVTTDQLEIYMSLLVSENANYTPGSKNLGIFDIPAIFVEILEVKSMEASMVTVQAEEMSSELGKEGHIALYGIQFDFDSDKLKAESDETLDQIARLLNADPSLKLYVVGHTDNKGTPEYNLDLSMRRAKSVIHALVSGHGISANRMHPFGAGLFTPIATNRTEEGQAKNRRVELVER